MAGQLLTTEAYPTQFVEGQVYVSNTIFRENSYTVPSGDAFVLQQLDVDAQFVDPPTPESGGDYSESSVSLWADTTSSGCSGGTPVNRTDAAGGNVGNVITPFVRGIVFTSGELVDAFSVGLSGLIFVTGYLVPSADAPSVAHIQSHGNLEIPRSHRLSSRLRARLPRHLVGAGAPSAGTSLLDEPSVAVGIAEREERPVVGTLWIGSRNLGAILEVEDVRCGHSSLDELGASQVDIADDEV
jgi:hypothetical protein